jgi:hypothetical protein
MLGILGLAVGGIKDYFKSKQEIKKIKVEQDKLVIVAETQAKIKRLENEQSQDYNLDKLAMEDMKNGYLDELLLFAFLYPVFSSYYTGGFDAINNIPTWYLSLVVGMVVVKYGMRGMLRDFMNGKYKSLKLGK